MISRRKNAYTRIIFIISILLHGGSLLLTDLTENPDIHPSWDIQFTWIIILSSVLTVVVYFHPRQGTKITVFILRFILIFVVYLPTGIRMGAGQTFITAFILDLAFLSSYPLNLGLGMGTILTVSLFSELSRSLSIGIPPQTLPEIISNIFSLLLLLLFASFFEQIHQKLGEKEKRIANLLATINKLTDANTGFQHYVKVVEVKSSEDERNRIIRELHDSLGYTMTSIIMLSESGIKMSQQEGKSEIEELFSHISNSSKTGLTDIRIALRIMKPKKPDKLSNSKKLKELIAAFERATNVRIILEYNFISDNISPESFHLIFRLIQEGMINSFRHGEATIVKIRLFQGESKCIVSISDNGKGFGELSVGLGLKGIEERISRIDGEFSIYNTSEGVTLRAVVPVQSPEKEVNIDRYSSG